MPKLPTFGQKLDLQRKSTHPLCKRCGTQWTGRAAPRSPTWAQRAVQTTIVPGTPPRITAKQGQHLIDY
eukprot:12938036-Prorocentrum_lima.AAC.1